MGLGDGIGLPPAAVEWATAAAPDDVVDIAPTGGGVTGTKWVLLLAGGDRLVLRWADPRQWGPLGHEHARREVLACELLAGSGLPVPDVVASDLDGAAAGGPANLLTWRPGRSRLNPLAGSAVEALARAAVAVHRHPVRPDERPPAFTFRGADDPQVPAWTGRPGLWREAIEIFRSGPPPGPDGLLHRDFHLGNTLWEGDEVSGLIDWAETSWGLPDADVAHMCSDFAMMHSVADAERFRRAYGAAGGRLDPDATRFWTVSDVLGFLPDPAHILPAVMPLRPDLSAAAIRERLEGLLAVVLDAPSP